MKNVISDSIKKLKKLCSLNAAEFDKETFKCMNCGKTHTGSELIHYDEDSSRRYDWSDGHFPCCGKLSEFYRNDLSYDTSEAEKNFVIYDLSECLVL